MFGGLRRRACWWRASCPSSARVLGRRPADHGADGRGRSLICLLGVVDDKWELDALTKLAGQVLAAGVMVLRGVQMLYLPIGNLAASRPTASRRVVLGRSRAPC